MTHPMLSFVDGFVPQQARQKGNSDLFRARAFVAFQLSILLVCIFYTVLFGALAAPALGFVGVCATLAYVALLLWFRRSASFSTAAHVYGAIPVTAIVWGSVLSAGFTSAALLWLFVIPMTVMLLAGSRAGGIWAGITMATIAAFFGLFWLGIEMPSTLSAQATGIFRLFTLLATQVIAFAMCYFYELLWVRAEREAQDEREIVASVFDAQEVNRTFLAYDIHDGLLQLLAAAGLRLGSFEDRYPDGQGDPDLLQVRELLNSAIAEGRRLINDLRPPVLDEFGIVEAIEWLVRDSQGRYGLKIDFQADGGIEAIPMIEIALFRICQESLANVVKHSKAETAKIHLSKTEHGVELSVKDDGVGFSVSSVDRHGFGLRGIRERARLLGGSAEITSQPGSGTTVRVVFPIQLSSVRDVGTVSTSQS